MKEGLVSFETVYCYICGRRMVAVARYQMICLVLLNLEHMKVPNGNRYLWEYKCRPPQLACRTRCKCSIENSEFVRNVKFGNKVQVCNKVYVMSGQHDQRRKSLHIGMLQIVM